MKHLSKLFTVLSIAVVFAVSGFTPQLFADHHEDDKTEKKEKAKKPRAYPFRGKLGAVDKKAQSITLHGKEKSRTLYLSKKTKTQKNGKPATLEGAIVGEEVAGSILPDENGKLMLKSLRFGPKPKSEKKPAKAEKQKDS